eukprot:scaffold29073_cov184-Amphora_coffeaeformis.AAC.3
MSASDGVLRTPLLPDDMATNTREDAAAHRGSTDEQRQLVFSTTPSRLSRPLVASMYFVGLVCVVINVVVYSKNLAKRQQWAEATWVDKATRDEMIQQIDVFLTRILHQAVFFAIAIAFPFLVLIPRRIEVYSDSTLVMRLPGGWGYRFSAVRSAKRNSNYCDTRLRWDFATAYRNRVFVKRAGRNRWEVACSPSDPDGFVAAIDACAYNDHDHSPV